MYFPKSQIKTNLYTNGDEFSILGNNTFYIGYYYSVSNGKFYTGKNPNSGENFELFSNTSLFTNNLNSDSPLIDNEDINEIEVNIVKSTDEGDFDADSTVDIPEKVDWKENQENNYKYYNLAQTTNRLVPPKINPSQPITEETNNGIYQRYYVKDILNTSYYEISKETFKSMATSDLYALDLFDAIVLSFKIGRENDGFNHYQMITAELKFNWVGFASISPFNPTQDYLNTSGGDFLLPNRTNYIGFYHIEGSQYITGRYSGDGPKTTLIPLKSTNTLIQSNNTNTPLSNTTSSPSSGGGGGY